MDKQKELIASLKDEIKVLKLKNKLMQRDFRYISGEAQKDYSHTLNMLMKHIRAFQKKIRELEAKK